MAWLPDASLSFAAMVAAVFLSDWNQVDPYTASGVNSLGVLLLSCLWLCCSWARLYCRLGIFPTLYNSTIFKPTLVNGEVSFKLKSGVAQCFLSGCLQFAGFISIAVTCYALPNSMGLYASIISCSSLTLWVLLFLAHNSKTSFWQGFGLCLCTFGIILMCLESKTEAKLSVVLVSVVTLFFFSARYFFIRQAANLNLDSVTAAIVTNLAHGLIGVLAWGCLSLDFYVDYRYHWRGLATGLLIGISSICINSSIFKGPAAPATMILNLYIVVFSLFDYRLYYFSLDTAKLPDLLIVAAGVGIMLGGDWVSRSLGCSRESRYSSLERPLMADNFPSI
mmetsp:Transcript_25458/g.44291  ORF Transcript_25458/g.44291 Transcript_25458/m.44291 type:complete len:336 (+) Transcript_25458:873-1880(+)